MSPVGAIFMPFPHKTGTNMLHPRPPLIVELVNIVHSFFVLRYACAPTATRSYLATVCVFFLFLFLPFLFLPFFVSLEMSLFSSILVTVSSFYVKYAVCFPFSDDVFLPCESGLDYLRQLIM